MSKCGSRLTTGLGGPANAANTIQAYKVGHIEDQRPLFTDKKGCVDLGFRNDWGISSTRKFLEGRV